MIATTPKKRKRTGSKVTRRRNRRIKFEAALRVLADRWPTAFRLTGERLPLKVGIDADVVTEIGSSLARWRLGGAIGLYTSSALYLRAMQDGAARVDLQGNPAGIVTAEDAASARERLGQIRGLAKARKRGMRTAPVAQAAEVSP
jgi:ProP effector